MRELEELQDYVQRRQLLLPGSGKARGQAGRGLERLIRNKLTRASHTGLIRSSPHDILRYVKCFRERDIDPTMARNLKARSLFLEAFVVTGGTKNQGRSKDVEHFARDDGAWFDFSITGRELAGSVELLAYDFEIRLPPAHGTPFVRFDLNLPEHDNERRSLRCHVHCGSDDLLLPSPLLAPVELLSLFIDGLRLGESRKAARIPTQCEVEWLKQTLDETVRSG